MPLGSYPAAARIALPSDPAQAQGVLALQQHGGVGPRSRSMQILGFCKPTVSRVETVSLLSLSPYIYIYIYTNIYVSIYMFHLGLLEY